MNRTASAHPFAPLKDNAWREIAEIDDRLARGEIIGVFNEQVEERPTEDLVQGWGYRIAGRSERTNRHKPAVDYRVFWIEEKR